MIGVHIEAVIENDHSVARFKMGGGLGWVKTCGFLGLGWFSIDW